MSRIDMILESKRTIDKERESILQSMRDYFDEQNNPEIGIFWYLPGKNILFGVQKNIASSQPFVSGKKVYAKLHKSYWQEQYRRGTPLFNGPDYTLIPRGRVSETVEKGMELWIGSWYHDYPSVLHLIKEEFHLSDVFVRIDSHWDIGQGWEGI